MQTFNSSPNTQCLEYRCEHCGFDWRAIDEWADTDDCPNCSAPAVEPCLAQPIQLAFARTEARS